MAAEPLSTDGVYILMDHLLLSVKKGGHGFERRNVYNAEVFYPAILETVHHNDHAKLQRTLQHKTHRRDIELRRELLLKQYWNGRQWIKPDSEQQPWRKLGPGITIGDPELVRALFEVARVFGASEISIRLRN